MREPVQAAGIVGRRKPLLPAVGRPASRPYHCGFLPGADDASTFEEAVLKAVNLGDDADTTGAICGQLAGAYWGESGIPQSLRSGLPRMDMIEGALAGIL